MRIVTSRLIALAHPVGSGYGRIRLNRPDEYLKTSLVSMTVNVNMSNVLILGNLLKGRL